MAHTENASARLQRLTSLVATLLVAVAVALAFGRVFLETGSTFRLLAMGVASGTIAWALERRNLLLATAVSAVLLVVSLGLIAFPETMWYGLPTTETLRQMGGAAAAVGEQARIQVAPTPSIDPLLFAAATAVWAAVFSCHALAFRAGSPLLALVPPVALVAFADSVLEQEQRAIYGVVFLIAALAVMFADSLQRLQGWGAVWQGIGHRDRLLPAAGRGARRVGAVTIGIALLAPVVVPGFGSKAVIDLSRLNAEGGIAVSPLVSIGAVLTRGDQQDVFRVTTDVPSYYRMTALEQFDGVSWQPTESTAVALGDGEPLPVAVGNESFTQEFEVLNDLAFPWLPVAYRATTVTVDGGIAFEERTETVEIQDPLEAGALYEVTSSYEAPTTDDLRADGTSLGATDTQLLQLPTELSPEIVEIAEGWTAGAESSYDKVMAIQEHLTDPNVFRYSVNASEVETRDDSAALLSFLQVSRVGFCQQFASAMAVLLRAVDIPARVAVGFTTGEQVGGDDGGYVVTTSDLHAWVEVPFDTYGFLPFEPTPGQANPAMQHYSRGGRGGGDGGCLTPNCIGDSPGGEEDPDRPPTKGGPEDDTSFNPRALGEFGGATEQPTSWVGRGIAAAGVALLLALILVPVVRVAVRRRRVRRARDPRGLILATYDVFGLRAAELGFPRGAAETPSEFKTRVLTAVGAPADPLGRLTGLTELAAYAPVEPTPDDALDAEADARGVIEAMRDEVPWHRKIIGLYLPSRRA